MRPARRLHTGGQSVGSKQETSQEASHMRPAMRLRRETDVNLSTIHYEASQEAKHMRPARRLHTGGQPGGSTQEASQ